MISPKIYISGPITHTVDGNRLAFENAKKALQLIGFEVINPHENGLPFNATYNQHLVKNMELLLECDAIYLLQGWTDSYGSRVECFMADNRGLQLLSYHTPIEMLHEYVTVFKEQSLENEN